MGPRSRSGGPTCGPPARNPPSPPGSESPAHCDGPQGSGWPPRPCRCSQGCGEAEEQGQAEAEFRRVDNAFDGVGANVAGCQLTGDGGEWEVPG